MQKLSSVLLVDDDSETNYLNTRLLERLGVADTLLVAESGQQALDLLEQPEAPALVLLDIKMPGMSGIELLEQYQQARQAHSHATVVLMLTSTMNSKDLLRINELQIDGLVSKPLTEEKLNDILSLHFQRTLPSA